MMPVVIKLFPQLNDLNDTLNDPFRLHAAVEEALNKLAEVLEYDHVAGYTTEHCRQSVGHAESEQVVSSWNNGYREVNFGGNPTSGVQEPIQQGEGSSQDGDN